MSSGENIIFLMVIRSLCVIKYVFRNDTDTLNTTIHPGDNFRPIPSHQQILSLQLLLLLLLLKIFFVLLIVLEELRPGSGLE
jgi:hypothetical protein